LASKSYSFFSFDEAPHLPKIAAWLIVYLFQLNYVFLIDCGDLLYEKPLFMMKFIF
jgi:hypothetical protein